MFYAFFIVSTFAQSWYVVDTSLILGAPDFSDVSVVDENVAHISCSSQANIFRTDNGAVSFSTQITSLGTSTEAIYMIDASTGFCGGGSGFVYNTVDGGANWRFLGTMATTLTDMDFVSANQGYACGDGGVIIKTTNGGLNWVLQITPTTQKIYRIEFFDNNNGIAIIKSSVTSTLWTNSGGFVWGFASFTGGVANSTMHDCDAVRGTSRAWIIGYHGILMFQG